MQAAAQQLAEAIVQATAVSHNPGSSQQQRAEAVQFFEQLKQGEIHATVFAAAVLTGGEYALEVQVSAYGLLHYLVKQRWKELTDQERQQVTQLAYQHLQDVGYLGAQAAWVLKSKAAMLLATTIRQQGAAAYEALVPQLVASADQGAMQAEIACLVLQFVSEDLTQFEEQTAGSNDKRSFLASLVSTVPVLLPFLAQVLQRHFQQAVSSSQSGGSEAAARPHAAVVHAALGTLSSFVDWAPLSRINDGQVVEACAFFLTTNDFRQAAVDVLKQVSGRRVSSEEAAAGAALMDKVGDALMAATAAVMAPNAAAELDYEGSLEEYGKRLCGALVAFGEHHFGALSGLQKMYTFLQHMLSFTRHPYLLLCGLTFPFWSLLLREAEKAANGNGPQARASTPDAAAGTAASASPPFVVPPDCCQLLVEALAGHLQQVAVRPDEGGEVPPYFDSPGEFKELCGMYRGTIKLIVRSAAVLAPKQVLGSTSLFLQQALAVTTSASATTSQKQQHMEAGAQLLEAIMQVLVEGAPSNDAGIREGLTALLRQLLALRIREPLLMMLHARALEAFSRHLSNAPDMVVPLIQATFECMQLLPLEANGQLPPPAHVTPQWKEQAQARIAMAKVLLNVAKLVPLAFISQLQPLVVQIQALWEQGLLRHGERMVLYEGLMAAAGSAAPLHVQTQLLEWVLRPVHAKWSSTEWLGHLATPRAFAAQYMAFEVGADGAVTVGSREQRWTLYHEISLFERILRRAPTAAGSGSATPTPQQQQQQEQQQQVSPFVPHLEWALGPVAAIISCVHGLMAPEMRAAIAPLAPAFDIDPVERAHRGGEKDATRMQHGDPGTLAGPSITALQYWLRGVREGAYMVVSFAAQTVDALWATQALSATIPKALVSHLDVLPQHWMRMLIRHAIITVVTQCPQGLRAVWLLPMFSVLMPHMQRRLDEGWARLAQQGQQQQAGEQVADEVVTESIFRELSREHMNLLVKACERPPPAAAPAAAAASLSPQQQGQESVLETLWRHDVGLVQALVGTAVSALRWPDAVAAQRGAVVCRFVVGLAENSHPELEGLVLTDMLRSAIMSMVQVSSITIQADLLALLRNILVAWLPRSQLAHDTLLQLGPQVTPQLLASFQSAFLANGSEKEQRSMVKQLLAHASNDEARAVLNAVSKVPVLTNVADAKAKQPGVQPGEEIRWDWGDSGVAF